ncbi:hypothetical protein C482_10806 [Natrialba chahannaoensis JCM 10990]|uniref:Uncharacterized protein n=1 Tax=Natrialba chahannaoensis JCM 10990 TaxID=1227492 RepID=M0AL51_9EURY|nr:hypothetical protein [Natrialba chahannaoensis]ELY99041.1 hypothetical protein C482_10806 [Natrialba chahannaoensis JCM 10990]
MRRRRYLTGLSSVATAGIAGCAGHTPADDDQSAPGIGGRSDTDVDVDIVTETQFEDDLTPLCGAGESLPANVDGVNAAFVTDHEFVPDHERGHYGVRGRIVQGDSEESGADGAPRRRGNVPSVHVAFSDGSTASERIYGLESDESYAFTVVTAAGDLDDIKSYELTVPDGATADIGHVPAAYATIDDEQWGQIGTHDGDAVYGCVASVKNDHDRSVELYPRYKAFLDETTVAASGTAIESSLVLDPNETQTVSFPYRRCDPGAVVSVDTWLEWSTMLYP